MGIKYKALRLSANGDCCLNLSGTRLTDLSALIELPVTHLCLQGCFEITDFSPLKDMNLIWLNLSRTNVGDLSPMNGLPLTYLKLWRTRITDLAPLKRAPLTSLDIRFTYISDLSPLKHVPLRALFFFPKRIVKGLGILRDMKTLKRINRSPATEFWKRHDVIN